jgi:hypothetical protein
MNGVGGFSLSNSKCRETVGVCDLNKNVQFSEYLFVQIVGERDTTDMMRHTT